MTGDIESFLSNLYRAAENYQLGFVRELLASFPDVTVFRLDEDTYELTVGDHKIQLKPMKPSATKLLLDSLAKEKEKPKSRKRSYETLVDNSKL